MAATSPDARTRTLHVLTFELRRRRDPILQANARDGAAACAVGLSEAMLDRLTLDTARVESMAQAVEAVAAQPDPVGVEVARWTRPNGLDIARVRTPLGVVAVI